jgi:hypothetical protein
MVAKRHKITNVPLFKKLWDIIVSSAARDNLGVKKVLAPQNVPRNGSKSYCPAKIKLCPAVS